MSNVFFQVIDKTCSTQDNRNLWNITKVRAEYYGGKTQKIHFLKDFIYLFLERGCGREKEGEKHWIDCLLQMPQPGIRPATQACALTRNRTGDLLFAGRRQLSHTGQGSYSSLKKTVHALAM